MADAIVSKDGESLYYYAAFEKGMDLWKMDLRKHETKLLEKTGSRMPSLAMDDDGNLYAFDGDGMKKIDGKSDKLTPITFNAKMNLDLAEERSYMYHHMAKQIEKKIFRTDYNGCDWPFMVKNYERLKTLRGSVSKQHQLAVMTCPSPRYSLAGPSSNTAMTVTFSSCTSSGTSIYTMPGSWLQ